eukprot:scaffold977_cov128-Cylindrotheca_fusiformis.AAC.3
MSIWYASLLRQSQPGVLVSFAPVWILGALALYAVVSIGHGVVICKDAPGAAREIEIQVEEAKREMKRRGIIA